MSSMWKSCLFCAKNYKKFNYVFKRAIHVQLKSNNNIRPIITCRRKEYNFYLEDNNKNNRLDIVKLASKGWHNRKSRGDYFIIHMIDHISMLEEQLSFTDLKINDKLVANLNGQGLVHPTRVQAESIPILFSKRNALIAAETGCGKTLSYLIPAVQQIIEQKRTADNDVLNSPICLILTPSRELAYQIESVASSLCQNLNIHTDVIVGGGTKRKMLNPNFKKVDLLVATLGALSKLTTTGIFRMNCVKHVVLDEADTLLDESFSEKLAYFLRKIPLQYSGEITSEFRGAQMTLVSATMPTKLPEILSDIIVPESLVRITSDQLHYLLPHVPQRFLRLSRSQRPGNLLQLVKADSQKNYPVMIFTQKSATCDWVSMFLNENGISCTNFNGDMSLYLRRNKFSDFNSGSFNVISCTDVGSRGLDTRRVKHVINYDFPEYMADYIHRCGRIGRIGSPENCHITNFVSGYHEIEMVQKIETAARCREVLPNVNGNISGIIKNNLIRRFAEEM